MCEPIDIFSELQSGDFLFIDSSHTVKYKGDVNFELLEVMPALRKGVHIHIHDIWFPYDYPPDWIFNERRAWAEMYLLEAFLEYNNVFTVELSGNLLSLRCESAMKQLWHEGVDWSAGNHHRSGAFWMEKSGA